MLDCEVSEEGKILPGHLCDFFVVVKNLWCVLSSGAVVTAIKSDQHH